MNSSRTASGVHAWWERVPGERYWLDVTEREGRERHLASPRPTGRDGGSWITRMITHVRDGDVVFHYDSTQQAIAAWSISQGQVQARRLSWASPVTSGAAAERAVSSWSIRLRNSERLDEPVTLHEIARVQWDLFPSLRALEDEAGAALHYPFEMGDREATRPIPGYVFKLPAVFVQSFPELARVAGRANRMLPGHLREPQGAGALAVHPLAHSR